MVLEKTAFENIFQLFIASVEQSWPIFSVGTHIVNILVLAGHIQLLLLPSLPFFYNSSKI